MPKVSIYPPDPLYAAVRAHNIPVSAVAQRALEEAVRRRANAAWIARVRSREPTTNARIDTSAVLEGIRTAAGRC